MYHGQKCVKTTLIIGRARQLECHFNGGEIEPAMRFIRKHQKKDPLAFINNELKTNITNEQCPPGFGSYMGGVNIMSHEIASRLVNMPAAGKGLKWGNQLAEESNCNKYQ